MMITLPDLVELIKYYIIKTIDYPLKWMEHWGSKMNVYAWNKRWRNRGKGTGYVKKPKVY